VSGELSRRSDEQYLLELDYTPYAMSCRDPYVTDRGELVLCRRGAKHNELHATRRGAECVTWGDPQKG